MMGNDHLPLHTNHGTVCECVRVCVCACVHICMNAQVCTNVQVPHIGVLPVQVVLQRQD